MICAGTLITAGLESGGHVRDLQDQAGHANAATTLRYAQASDAQARTRENPVAVCVNTLLYRP